MTDHTTTRRTLLAGGVAGSAFGGLMLATDAEAAVTVPAQPSVDFFLVVPGVPGDSLDDRFKGAFDVLDWSFGATTSVGPTSSGGARGKVKPQPFVFVTRVSKASPVMFKACCTGRHFPSVELTARKRSGEQFLQVTLKDVYVSSYRAAPGSVDAVPLDVVGVDYAALEITVKPQNPDGSIGAAVTAGFDFVKNQVL